jgi:hypothetical protein
MPLIHQASTHGILAAVALVLLIFIVCTRVIIRLRKNWPFVSFEPNKQAFRNGQWIYLDETHNFEGRLTSYLRLAEVVTTLASASIVFLSRGTTSTHPGLFAFTMTSFALCVLFSVLFMLTLLYFYEDSLYDYKNYTVPKSAVVIALGITGLLSFAAAYLVLGMQLAEGLHVS